MGRQQHLERMALGRSAFEDPEPGFQHHPQEASDANHQGDGRYVQKYDTKGRPVNPATEERKRAMRHAQNAALELVGVVERKDDSNKLTEMKHRYVRDQREVLLKAEHDRGEDLGLLSSSLQFAFTWLPRAMIARVGIGMYSPSMTFSEIVTSEVGEIGLGGIKNLSMVMLPGAPAYAIYEIIRLFAYYGVAEGIDRLSTMWARTVKRQRTVRRIKMTAQIASELLCFVIDLVLLPLQYIAETQRLGLAPASPLLPYWRSILPFGPASVAPVVWSSGFQVSSLVGALYAPAARLLLRDYLTRNQDDEVPVARPISSFAYPPINASQSAAALKALSTTARQAGPVDNLLYQLYRLRVKTLRWLGWKLEHITEHSRAAKEYENNYVPLRMAAGLEHLNLLEPDDAQQYIYRSTSLSYWAADYVADCLDNFFIRVLIKIPCDAFVFRSIAQSYLASPLPKTSQAIAAIPHLYTSFGGGPLGRLLGSNLSAGAWRETGGFLSRLGLGLALQSTMETAIFFTVYRIVRWQGRYNFDWGKTNVCNSEDLDEVIEWARSGPSDARRT